MPKYIIVLIIILSIVITSCSKTTPIKTEIIDIIPQEIIIPEETIQPVEEEVLIKKDYNLNILSDLVVISSLESLNIKSNEFAVIGNKTQFYSYVKLDNNSDLEKLVKLETLDQGSIIAVNNTVLIENTINENYFKFQGDNNYFYETEINGIRGLIWGADLIVNITDSKEATKISYYYTKQAKSENFLPFNGLYNLSEKNILDISNYRLSFQGTKKTDTMINLYKTDSKIRNNTIFLTTDLLTHALTTLINEFLPVYEIDVIVPELINLIDEFLIIIERYKENDEKNSIKYTELLFNTKNYFLLTNLLLNYSEELKSVMPQIVIDEYDLIINAMGFSISPILKYSYDYSIYSENNILSKGLTWLTQSNMDVRMSLFMNMIVKENKELFDKWTIINGYFSYIRGETRDLDFNKTITLVDDYVFTIFPTWIEDDKNIQNFISKNNLSSESFRIFGRSYNIDDNIPKLLSTPFLPGRDHSINLDIMNILGSRSAKSLLNQYESNESFREDYINDVKNIKESLIPDSNSILPGSYHSNFLDLIRSITTFEQSRNFFFTVNGKWNQKSLLTSHGSLAELKNTTIINNDIKSSYNEDEIPSDISFRFKDYKRPIHYVEPNKKFFIVYNFLIADLLKSLNFEKITDRYESKFKRLLDISSRLLKVVENETSNLPITDKQNEYIVTVPSLLSRIVKTSSPVLSNTSNSYFGTGLPMRLLIALKDDQGGKRIATGYTYSYYEFAIQDNIKITSKEWVTNFYDDKQNLESLIPFWAMDSVK